MHYTLLFEEKDKWQYELNDGIKNNDIYFSLSYCDLYRELGDGDPHLFVYTDKCGDKILYPFLKRKINNLPFVKDRFQKEIFDITTPYGYGGPIHQNMSTAEPGDVIKRFRSTFNDYCREKNIITEFIRFHPLLNNHLNMSNLMDVHHIRDTVFIDLTKKEEEIFNNYHRNHRRNVKKAEKNGLTFQVLEGENTVDEIDTFIKLYKDTMKRNSALSYYYFPKYYFEHFFHNLSQNSVMCSVRLDNHTIAAAIFMFQGDFLHYHLGCSDQKFLSMAPNNLLFHEMARWGKKNGFKKLHLGGGYTDDDQLFQFKHKFNPDGRLSFFIGKCIHDEQIYEELVRLWTGYYSKEINTDYFPLYRQ